MSKRAGFAIVIILAIIYAIGAVIAGICGFIYWLRHRPHHHHNAEVSWNESVSSAADDAVFGGEIDAHGIGGHRMGVLYFRMAGNVVRFPLLPRMVDPHWNAHGRNTCLVPAGLSAPVRI